MQRSETHSFLRKVFNLLPKIQGLAASSNIAGFGFADRKGRAILKMNINRCVEMRTCTRPAYLKGMVDGNSF